MAIVPFSERTSLAAARQGPRFGGLIPGSECVILGSECVVLGSECLILGSDHEKAWIERATFVIACVKLTIACEERAIGRVECATPCNAFIIERRKRVITRDVRPIESIKARTHSDVGFTRSDRRITRSDQGITHSD